MAPLVFINNQQEVMKMFHKLFSPVRIGGLEIKNRVAITAMGVSLAAAGGGVNDDIIAFYEARARGGIGHIVDIISGIAFSPMAYQTMYSATKAP